MGGKYLSLILLLVVSIFASNSNSFPLSTNKRWIVDESGKRVKLHCVNWSGHMNAMVAEGLNIIPLKDVISQLKGLGFNCVRYTWATHMFTRYSTSKVGENLDKLNLTGPRLGIGFFNPPMENITVVEAFDFVIDEFGKHGMMVLVDNHVSDPKWCCDNNDGNGFFGDQSFNPEEWLQGLSNVANHVKKINKIVYEPEVPQVHIRFINNFINFFGTNTILF